MLSRSLNPRVETLNPGTEHLPHKPKEVPATVFPRDPEGFRKLGAHAYLCVFFGDGYSMDRDFFGSMLHPLCFLTWSPHTKALKCHCTTLVKAVLNPL